MKKTLKYTIPFLLCFFAVLAIADVTKPAKKPYVLSTHWTAQTQFAGYILADHEKMFQKNGVDVRVQFHDSVHNPVEMLTSGRSQFAVMTLFGAMKARMEGIRLVNVMQTSQHSSYCIVSHNPIRSINDLRGKELSVWHGLDELVPQILSKRTDNTLQSVEVFSGIEVFLSGAIDNILVTSYNEMNELEDVGFDVDSTQMFTFMNSGLDMAEDGLYVTEEFYNSHKSDVEKVVKALTDSWHTVYENREYTINLVLEQMARCGLPHNRYHERRALDEVLRLQCVNNLYPEQFELREKSFLNVVSVMKEVGLIKGKLPYSFNDFTKQ